jgi:hypothetical protein
MKSKQTKKSTKIPAKEKKPFHIPLNFEDAIKVAVNTPIKNSKINKK